MNEQLLAAIDKKIEESRTLLTNLLMEFVNIKSEKGEAKEKAPFGEGPRNVLAKAEALGKESGFFFSDYGVGVISLALESETPDLGIWIHADVVPAGDGWNFEPYNATEYKDWVIGRGARDNKGSLVSSFLILKFFKDLGIKLKYNPALYIGSDEESGMGDMKGALDRVGAEGFINVSTPPKLSLVPDSGKFPVGYGGKGSLNLTLKSKTPLKSLTFNAGKRETPGLAVAKFKKRISLPDNIVDCNITHRKKTEISAYSVPVHASEPSPDGNMITALTKVLLDYKLVENNDRKIISFFKDISLDIYGNLFNIATDNEEMGPLTVFTSGIDEADGYPEIRLCILYPLGITYESIVEKVERVANERGFALHKAKRGVDAYKLDKNWSVIQILNEISNEITGRQDEPFIMKGETYAHRLPNALVYGMDSGTPPTEFISGSGYAHSIDEAASISELQKSMKIYARALLKLNETDW